MQNNNQEESSYSFDAKTGHLIINSIVKGSKPWNDQKNKVKTVAVSEGITVIDKYFFSDYLKLQNIKLPLSLVEIGEEAFENCKSLETISLPENVETIGDYAFDSCTNLKSVNLPDSYIQAEECGIFCNCKSLETIYIGESPVYFDKAYNTVDKCSELKEIIVKAENETNLSVEGVLYYKDGTKYNLALFPPKSPITSFRPIEGTAILYPATSGGVFYKANNLKEVSLPDSVEEIWTDTFCQCENLEKISTGNGCVAIRKGAVNKCLFLKHLVIGDNVQIIEADAIKGCKQLETIELSPKNKHFLLEDGVLYAFESGQKKRICLRVSESKAQTFTIPEGTEVIEKYAFLDCKTLKELIIPNSVKRIEYGAFKGCTGLKTITFPNSLEYIAPEAFMKCSALKTIVFEEGLFEIRPRAFESCTKLENVHFPSSLAIIACEAFRDCSRLKNITSDALFPPTIDLARSEILKSPFYQCSYDATVFVEKEAFDSYKQRWKDLHINIRVKGDELTPSCIRTPQLFEGVSDIGLYHDKIAICYNDHFEIDGQVYAVDNVKKISFSKKNRLIHIVKNDESEHLFIHGQIVPSPQGRYEKTVLLTEDIMVSKEAKDGVLFVSVCDGGKEYLFDIKHKEAEHLSVNVYKVGTEPVILIESDSDLMFYNHKGDLLNSYDVKDVDWGVSKYVAGSTLYFKSETIKMEMGFNLLTGEKMWEHEYFYCPDFIVGPNNMLYALKVQNSETLMRNVDFCLVKLDPLTGEYTKTVFATKIDFGLDNVRYSIAGNRLYYSITNGGDIYYGVLDLDSLLVIEENVVMMANRKPAKQNRCYSVTAPIAVGDKVYVHVYFDMLNVFSIQ